MSASANAGQPARDLAVRILARVLGKRHAFEDALDAPEIAARASALDERDRRFAFALARTVLRRLGQIDALLDEFLAAPLPARAEPAPHILRVALAELLFMSTEPYAAVNSAVELAAADAKARHFRGLVNAVARRAAREGAALVAAQDLANVLMPQWLAGRWRAQFGDETMRGVVAAQLEEPPLDVTLKPGLDAAAWAEKLDATVLPTGALRRTGGGRIETLPGFEEGAWWVQDAAAALVPRLFGNVSGRTIIDLCAAPGGKTAWLAGSGAHVVGVDKSEARLERLKRNLDRLGLRADLIAADAREYQPAERASGVLLDAPCTGTGTIRRHPDLPWIKEPDDIRALSLLQGELLDGAFGMLEPGGTLVYSVCSLEPEEGPLAIEAFLARQPAARRAPLARDELAGAEPFVNADGTLRTLPSQWREHGGIDGFFAARIVKA